IAEDEGKNNGWETYFEDLIHAGRATTVIGGKHALWIATERVPYIQKAYPEKALEHDVVVPEKLLRQLEGKDAMTELVRGRLEIMGPTTAEMLAAIMGLSTSEVNQGLIRLENEGFVFRGKFTGEFEQEWCERRLLARIHRYTIKKLRSEIQPVSSADFMRFLFARHQLESDRHAEGATGLEHVIQKLEGFEAPAIAWESDILPARTKDYDHQWLDMLCAAGKISWGRFRPSSSAGKDKKANSPIRTTAVTFVSRSKLNAWTSIPSEDEFADLHLSARATQVLGVLQQYGASFFDDIVYKTKLFPSQAEDALGELIGAGLITSDSFTGLRALLVPDKYKTDSGYRRDTEIFSMNYAGRWSLLRDHREQEDHKYSSEEIETIAWALLSRYGVLFRKLAERENLAPPWRELVRTLRTLEARGQIRGGRFVEGVYGEQYALPEAIVELRKVKKENKPDVLVSISAADPLNLTGIITPGRRIPGFTGNRILYQNGVPVVVKEAKEIQFLIEPDAGKKWAMQNALIQHHVSPRLRKYLGKATH
ncbi:MAG: Lhr family helicase, partial [Bacteroidota bacterium]